MARRGIARAHGRSAGQRRGTTGKAAEAVVGTKRTTMSMMSAPLLGLGSMSSERLKIAAEGVAVGHLRSYRAEMDMCRSIGTHAGETPRSSYARFGTPPAAALIGGHQFLDPPGYWPLCYTK